MSHTALHGHAEAGHVREFVSVVRRREDGLGEILAHFAHVDVEGGDEVDVGDVIVAEDRMHDAGNILSGLCLAVEMHTLHER